MTGKNLIQNRQKRPNVTGKGLNSNGLSVIGKDLTANVLAHRTVEKDRGTRGKEMVRKNPTTKLQFNV